MIQLCIPAAANELKNQRKSNTFEMYIKMYGLLAYNEMDPTWFVVSDLFFSFRCNVW